MIGRIYGMASPIFTLNVVCREENVERLVYTSTFNVVFGGQVIENGDESLPYLPLEMVSELINLQNGDQIVSIHIKGPPCSRLACCIEFLPLAAVMIFFLLLVMYDGIIAQKESCVTKYI